MSEIVLHEPLASQIRREAEAEGVQVESLIEAALRKRIRSQYGKTPILITLAAGRRELRIVSTKLI